MKFRVRPWRKIGPATNCLKPIRNPYSCHSCHSWLKKILHHAGDKSRLRGEAVFLRLKNRSVLGVDGCVSSPGRSHCHDPICRGHGSKECAAEPTPNGPTARHNVASGSPRGLGSEFPKLFPNSQPIHSSITTGGSGWLLFASRKLGIPCDSAAECPRQHPVTPFGGL